MKNVLVTFGIGCIGAVVAYVVGGCYGYITACNEVGYDVTIDKDFGFYPKERARSCDTCPDKYCY